jgi:hypothetical protein
MYTYYTYYGTVSPLLLHALAQPTPPQNYYKGSSSCTGFRNSTALAPPQLPSNAPASAISPALLGMAWPINRQPAPNRAHDWRDCAAHAGEASAS